MHFACDRLPMSHSTWPSCAGQLAGLRATADQGSARPGTERLTGTMQAGHHDLPEEPDEADDDDEMTDGEQEVFDIEIPVPSLPCLGLASIRTRPGRK